MKSSRLVFSSLVALSLAALLSGCGQNSTPTGVTALDETAPAAPSQLTRQADDSAPNGVLAWAPSTSANVAGYEIYQYAPDPAREDAYVLVGQTEATQTDFALPFSYAPQTAFYRLKAVSTAGIKSAWSATAGIPIGPTNGSGDETRTVDEPVMRPTLEP